MLEAFRQSHIFRNIRRYWILAIATFFVALEGWKFGGSAVNIASSIGLNNIDLRFYWIPFPFFAAASLYFFISFWRKRGAAQDYADRHINRFVESALAALPDASDKQKNTIISNGYDFLSDTSPVRPIWCKYFFAASILMASLSSQLFIDSWILIKQLNTSDLVSFRAPYMSKKMGKSDFDKIDKAHDYSKDLSSNNIQGVDLKVGGILKMETHKNEIQGIMIDINWFKEYHGCVRTDVTISSAKEGRSESFTIPCNLK